MSTTTTGIICVVKTNEFPSPKNWIKALDDVFNSGCFDASAFGNQMLSELYNQYVQNAKTGQWGLVELSNGATIFLPPEVENKYHLINDNGMSPKEGVHIGRVAAGLFLTIMAVDRVMNKNFSQTNRNFSGQSFQDFMFEQFDQLKDFIDYNSDCDAVHALLD